MTTSTPVDRRRAILSATLLALAIGLLAWQGDATVLAALGYLPMVIVGVITGDVDPAVLASAALWLPIGRLTVVLALLYAARRAWPRAHLLGALSEHRLHRTLTVAVIVAVIIPVGYAVTRIAWALGIPLGLSREFLDSIQDIVLNGLVLGILAIGGAALTVGLIRPWGERFPRWIPWLRGRVVPVGLARNAALVVALAVTSAGFYFIRSMVTGSIDIAPAGAELQWAAWLPELFWPAWGLALTVAAIGYAERRRREPLGLSQPQPLAQRGDTPTGIGSG